MHNCYHNSISLPVPFSTVNTTGYHTLMPNQAKNPRAWDNKYQLLVPFSTAPLILSKANQSPTYYQPGLPSTFPVSF